MFSGGGGGETRRDGGGINRRLPDRWRAVGDWQQRWDGTRHRPLPTRGLTWFCDVNRHTYALWPTLHAGGSLLTHPTALHGDAVGHQVVAPPGEPREQRVSTCGMSASWGEGSLC